jgi:hypothetical protein
LGKLAQAASVPLGGSAILGFAQCSIVTEANPFAYINPKKKTMNCNVFVVY